MKLSHRAPQLRRRTKISARVELLRNYCLVFLLFGALVVLFTPPTIDSKPSEQDGIETNATASDDLISIVTCEVSTPHSEHVENAASGKFDIAILKEDIARKGSSAEAFLKLVDEKFYDGCYTFCVIKGFVVQFGHRGDNQKANLERIPESDKPIIESSENDESSMVKILRKKQNAKGTITMISGKTGQVFVNTGDNRRLDKDGTLPFGAIVEHKGDSRHTGMNLVESIFNEYKGGQGQIAAVNNNQVATKFPEMGRIDRCYRKG